MALKSELGNIQIFFGTVVDVNDPQQMYRCRVAIPGKTDQIEKNKLPWYYSFNGIGSLPDLQTEVCVLIFDGNFATGMYGKQLISFPSQTKNTYKSYVEVFKSGSASVTYDMQNGVQVANDNASVNLNNNVELKSNKNKLSVTNSAIKLGSENLQPMLMGDDTVAYIKELLDYIKQLIGMIYGGFQTIMMVSTPNPFTSHIGAALTPFVPSELQLKTMLQFLETKADNLQSNKTFNA